MNVKLKYKTKDGQYFGTKKNITLSEAKKYFKDKLEKDDNVIEVYCVHFDGWHWYKQCVLKENKNE
jgi:hypothetical protein